uniref:Uncharacterized protein n=1 Tax=Macrostomum lignano TaxID=282301 RepID=A0A1I8FDW7_9PLAT
MDSLTARGLNKHFSLNISFENSTCSNRAALPAMEYYYSGRWTASLAWPVRKVAAKSSSIRVEMAFRDSANIQYRHDIFVRVSFDSGELIHSIVKAIFCQTLGESFSACSPGRTDTLRTVAICFMQGFNWVRQQRMNMKADYFDTQNRTFTEEEITKHVEAENRIEILRLFWPKAIDNVLFGMEGRGLEILHELEEAKPLKTR